MRGRVLLLLVYNLFLLNVELRDHFLFDFSSDFAQNRANLGNVQPFGPCVQRRSENVSKIGEKKSSKWTHVGSLFEFFGRVF